jgi:hypothetical protein
MRLSVYFICLIFGITAIGCSDFLDVNENPNQAVSATPELILSTALNATAGRLNLNEIGSYWSGQWAPSGSFSGFDGERTYNINATFRTGNWTGIYDNLNDYKIVETEAVKTGKFAIAGIARLMKAYNFQLLVDTYGNVPYINALRGTEETAPSYDNADVIYDSLLSDIDQAKVYLNKPVGGTNPSAGTADIIFGGNNGKWIRFANTLKLRMLLRISGVRSVATECAELAADADGFLKAGEDVASNPGYTKSAGKMNQFYEFFGYNSGDGRSGGHDAYAINEYILESHLVANNDPRKATIAYPAKDGVTYKGVPLGGQSDEFIFAKISGIGPAVLPNDNTVSTSTLYSRKQIVMTAAESFFLQAEAVQQGYMTSALTADSLFNTGIIESFRLNGLTKAAAMTYYNQSNIKYSSSSNKLQSIITQKWLANANFCGFEAWTEFRRTGYPNVPLSIKAQGTQQPVRLIYPQSEYSNNTTNVEAQGTISQYTSKIFWDIN